MITRWPTTAGISIPPSRFFPGWRARPTAPAYTQSITLTDSREEGGSYIYISSQTIRIAAATSTRVVCAHASYTCRCQIDSRRVSMTISSAKWNYQLRRGRVSSSRGPRATAPDRFDLSAGKGAIGGGWARWWACIGMHCMRAAEIVVEVFGNLTFKVGISTRGFCWVN